MKQVGNKDEHGRALPVSSSMPQPFLFLVGRQKGGTDGLKNGHKAGTAPSELPKKKRKNGRAHDNGTRAHRPSLPRRLCTIEAASDYLALSTWTIREIIGRGDLPHLRQGRRIMIDVQDLDAWIERKKIRGPS